MSADRVQARTNHGAPVLPPPPARRSPPMRLGSPDAESVPFDLVRARVSLVRGVDVYIDGWLDDRDRLDLLRTTCETLGIPWPPIVGAGVLSGGATDGGASLHEGHEGGPGRSVGWNR